MKKTTVILGMLIAFFISFSNAKALQTEDTENNKIDSVTFSYSFMAKDTLIYYSSSRDSVLLGYNDYLIKQRYQRTMVICDSVNKAGNRFFLKIGLIDYVSVESDAQTKDVVRKTTPWLGKWVRIEIDSAANRYSYGYEDTVNAMLAPGGAFDSYLFFPVAAYSKGINESWLSKSSELLPENGTPFPGVTYSSLMRALPPIDTLGRACNQFRFVRSGQGIFYLNTPEGKIGTTSIFDGGGFMRIDKIMKVPVHFYNTNMIKMKIGIDEERAQSVIQYLNTNWKLESHSRYGIIAGASSND